MARLSREAWYDVACDTNWTPGYVAEADLFPEPLSGALGIAGPAWERWDQPAAPSFREYVETQRENDPDSHSVKAAQGRSRLYDEASPGWQSVLKAYYGAFSIPRYQAALAEARMARFSRAPGNRNLALLGMLEGIRQGQSQLFVAHELCPKDRQLDWAYKALHTEAWPAIAIRHFFDDMMLTRSATETAVMLAFVFQSGFTSLGEPGDPRQIGQGAATLRVLVDNGKAAEAQRMIDTVFWRAWRLFCLVTGPAMDYYTPLPERGASFKERVLERMAAPLQRTLEDLGLDRPWYWPHFLASADSYQHALQLAVWYWRPTVWWNPRAGVAPEERDWLEGKYPGWNDRFGRCWDALIENGLTGQRDRLSPVGFPVLCNMCCLPIVGTPGTGWAGSEGPKTYSLDHLNRRYSFCSEPCRWIFEVDSDRYQGHLGLIDRQLRGQAPSDLADALEHMGLQPGERGQDAEGYRWIEAYRG